MKIFFIIIVSFFCSFNALTQVNKTLSRGRNSVNFFTGAELGMFSRSFPFADKSQGIRKITGPIGLTYEVMVSDRVGLGLNLIYTQELVDQAFFFGIGPQNSPGLMTTLRIFTRFNLHLYNKADTDIYSFTDLGPVIRQIVINQGGQITKLDQPGVGGRIGIGWRHFLNKYLGTHMELAAGNPFMIMGLSVRF